MRLLIALLLAIPLAACDSQSDTPSQGGVGKDSVGNVDIRTRGQQMPKVGFTAPDGSPVTLDKFRGKPLMVNLWATWCAPCVAEMPMLDALAVKQKDHFHLLTVSQDLAGKRAVEPFFAKHDFKALEPYLDKENALMMAFRIDTLPTTIFYDATGKEQWRVSGAMDWNGERAQKLIEGGLTPVG